MKQAILILAHKDFAALKKLIAYFKQDCYVFVHFDKSGEIKKSEYSTLKSDFPQVKEVYCKYSVQWGGFSMLKAELFLLKKAFMNEDVSFFHLLSGQDYPIKPLERFLSTFESDKPISYLNFVHLPHPKWQNNSYDRFKYYYPFDFVKNNRVEARSLSTKWIKFQKKVGISRRLDFGFDHLYGGSQWFSLHRSAVKVLLDYTKHHTHLYRRLKYTFAPEESYIHTVLVNSLSPKEIVNINWRFIRWKYENGNIPANLSDEHFHLLAESHALFARKLCKGISNSLKEKIDKYLINDSPLKIQQSGMWEYNGFLKYNYNEKLTECIFYYVRYLGLTTGIDIHCGCGYYVAALRRLHINMFGCDSNPYTEQLSSLLLPEGDTLCKVEDYSQETPIFYEYDFALVNNILNSISLEKLFFLIDNLTKNIMKSLILIWNKEDLQGRKTLVHEHLFKSGFRKNIFASKDFTYKVHGIHEIEIFEH